jgi:hypothetical protein
VRSNSWEIPAIAGALIGTLGFAAATSFEPAAVNLAITRPSASVSEIPRPFHDCAEARAAGAAPVYRGDPGYAPWLDGDHDGIGCEPYYGRDEVPRARTVVAGARPFRNCAEARAAGAAPVYEGDPRYAPWLDGDDDGIGCEPYHRH